MTGMLRDGIRGISKILITGRVLRNTILIGANTDKPSVMTGNFLKQHHREHGGGWQKGFQGRHATPAHPEGQKPAPAA